MSTLRSGGDSNRIVFPERASNGSRTRRSASPKTVSPLPPMTTATPLSSGSSSLSSLSPTLSSSSSSSSALSPSLFFSPPQQRRLWNDDDAFPRRRRWGLLLGGMVVVACYVGANAMWLQSEKSQGAGQAEERRLVLTPMQEDVVAVSDGLIHNISILGERNSGTRWMYNYLNVCFNNSVPVYRHLSRYKHWFQFYNETRLANSSTLVIAMFRNVFDWTEAMRLTPHHAAEHIGLDWKTFVTKPWTMQRVGLDVEMENRTGRVCQDDFYYHEVVSCIKRPYGDDFWKTHQRRDVHFSEHQPFYELQSDGTPYASIVDMRAAKIRNWLETIHYPGVEDVWVVHYEDLLRQGTADLLRRIEDATGIVADCPAQGPQQRSRRELDQGLVEWLKQNVDWETEGEIGYSKDYRP